jgi:hypothetical protein
VTSASQRQGGVSAFLCLALLPGLQRATSPDLLGVAVGGVVMRPHRTDGEHSLGVKEKAVMPGDRRLTQITSDTRERVQGWWVRGWRV